MFLHSIPTNVYVNDVLLCAYHCGKIAVFTHAGLFLIDGTKNDKLKESGTEQSDLCMYFLISSLCSKHICCMFNTSSKC